MDRKKINRWNAALAALLLLLVPSISLAQDEDAEQEDRDAEGTLFAEAAVWIAKPNGLGFVAASRVDPGNPFVSTPLAPSYGTETDIRWRVGYSFGNAGRIVGTWFGQSTEYEQFESTPGNFSFGETQASPIFAGYQNDGLADAFQAQSSASTRDLRLDYYRTFADTDRVHADWFVGLRRVQHNRNQLTSYAALVPDLPPLGPPLCDPCPDVEPVPDTVRNESKFTGRGVNAGVDVEFPFWGGNLILESGFSAAALLADVDTQYFSQTSYYNYVNPSGQLVILDPAGYADAFGGTRPVPGGGTPNSNVDFVTRASFATGISEINSSKGTFVLDGYIGLRSNVWRKMELFIGYRSAHYSDVGAETRPVVFTAGSGLTLDQNSGAVIGLNGQTAESNSFSVTQEGTYMGMAYRF